MTTPIPRLLLAVQGAIKAEGKKNPFASPPKKEADQKDPSPEEVNQKIRNAMAAFKKRR